MNPDFLSCDWGTTSFRLRRISGRERKVIREIREPAGVKALHEEATRTGTMTAADRAEVFASFLRAKLEALLADETPPIHPLPIVISGMASSSIGWRELPYAKVPFPLDGQGLHSEIVKWNQPKWVGQTFLISGMATARDIMRGEEMEIIGLMSDPKLTELRERSLLILPGTHSKHIKIEGGAVIDFRTFMTGELFEVLGRHTILRASVDLGARTGNDSLTDGDRTAFQDGVRWGKEHGIAGGLFRVRTRTVLDHAAPADNKLFLSGLLIGAELESIGKDTGYCPVILAATRGISELYKLALEIVAPTGVQWIQIPPEQVERATVAAHAAFLKTKSIV